MALIGLFVRGGTGFRFLRFCGVMRSMRAFTLALVCVNNLYAESLSGRESEAVLHTETIERALFSLQTPETTVLLSGALRQTGKDEIALGLSWRYFADSSRSMSFAQVFSPANIHRFKPSMQATPSFGLSAATYWFVAFAQKQAPRDDGDALWILEVGYPPLDSVELFTRGVGERESGAWSSVLVGDMLPFAARPIKTRNFAFPLFFSDTLAHPIVLRVATQSSLLAPVTLRSATRYAEETAKTDVAYGVFFGMLIALILYNGFLFLSLRSFYYAYYTVYISAGALYLAVLNGFASRYIWHNSPALVNYLNIGLLGALILFLSLFARDFLRLRHYAPALEKTLTAIALGGFALALGAIFLPYQTSVRLAVAMNFVSIAAVVVSAATAWKRGNASARYFLAAASFFLSGNIIFVLKTVGVLPSVFFTNHIVEIGLAVEGLLFAFALADRYRRFRQEKEVVQQEALAIQRKANAELESKVQERTFELEKINDEMQRQLIILNDQAVEIEMANVELQEKNLLLEGLNREKNEFLGLAAHDLKNPLQTIIMNASMIRRYSERINERQRDDLLNRIEETSRRMHDIIEKLLDANAIESGKIQLSAESFAIYDEVQKLVQDYEPKAESKQIRLRLVAPSQSAIRMLADKHRTLQVVENLLSNAIKFSPKNSGVTVAIERENENGAAEAHPYVVITVADEGPGLSDEDKTKLFGKFARLSAQPTGGEHSTGLGLSIVKKLVEAMHGDIRCESELGKGARFIVRLPADPAQ